MIQSQELLSD